MPGPRRASLGEDFPLVDDNDFIFNKTRGEAYLQFDNAIFQGDDSDDEMAGHDHTLSVKEQAFPGRKPMIIDAICLVLEYLQYYALIFSLSLRWTWPLNWTRTTSFMFLFNLDLWEFVKVISGAWQSSRDNLVPTANVPFSFKWWLISWYAILLLVLIGFVVARVYLKRREVSQGIAAGNILPKIAICLAQIVALPLGVQLGKVFWCNERTNVWNVDNDVVCWSGIHIVFVVVSLVLIVAFYPLYAFWLYKLIKSQVITFSQRRHEAYLQLKDCEYRFGLHKAWTQRLFIVFASYRRRWVYARPIGHLLKFFVICVYAGLFNYRLPQICLIGFVFFAMSVASWLPRIYRVTCYNFLSMWCWLILFINAVVGIFLNITTLESAFTTPTYVQVELIVINVSWLVVTLLWILYVLLRAKGVICAKEPLWPTMLTTGVKKLPGSTLRYMTSALEGRLAVKRAMEVPALLAPVHDLSHHIHVINALATEAEYVKDPMKSSLRDVLDELIDLHTRVSSQSLFSESLKPTVHSTVKELLKVLPQFAQRLKQREYDFILTSPVRRRILLKLFVMSCFLAKRRAREDETGGDEGRGGTTRVLRGLWRQNSGDSKGGSASDEGFGGDDVIQFQSDDENTIFSAADREQPSVIVSPTPPSMQSFA